MKYNTNIIQRFQVINLIILFIIGKFILDFQITWLEIGIVILSSVFIDHLILFWKNKKIDFFSYSSISTALGVVFLVRATDISIYLLVISIAILQKHFIQINNKHFLNPSNVAVVTAFILFPYSTYGTPEQWGSFLWLGILMMLLGIFINYLVNKLIIPIVFIISYSLFSYLFITHNIYEILLMIISGSFLLFMFFMITDPRTTPNGKLFQIIYALAIAFIAILLELTIGVKDVNIFLALMIVSFTVPIIRHFELISLNSIQQFKVMTFVILLIGLLYFSPLNAIRNFEKSLLIPKDKKLHTVIENNDTLLKDENTSIHLFKDENRLLYETHWNKSYFVKTPTNNHLSKKYNKFTVVQKTGFENYIPGITPKTFGWDYLHNNSIASGDINHDGLLDIVMTKPNAYMKIFINKGNNNFEDVTKHIFVDKVPFNVSHIALADFNNDSYLDLLVLMDGYLEIKANKIYLFNRSKEKFDKEKILTQKSLATKGGLAIHDLNNDKILDIYISNGMDFIDSTFLKNGGLGFGEDDELWMSSKQGWTNKNNLNLPYKGDKFAGMTALFSDINHDGQVDLLVGNDRQPNTTMLRDKEGKFNLIDKSLFEFNAFNSMSYFTADFDNDGIFEIWENGISVPKGMTRNRYKDYLDLVDYAKDSISQELNQLINQLKKGSLHCNGIKEPLVQKVCKHKLNSYMAIKMSDNKYCEYFQNRATKKWCQFASSPRKIKDRPNPFSLKYDVETYPKTVATNMVLKRDKNGNFINVLNDFDALHTGWTWGAYPYDIDNDGYQDIYLTTGNILNLLRQPNAMLLNTFNGHISFDNQAKALGIDDFNESRGLIIADFDGDGDGDILINNLYESPTFYQNNIEGDSIQITLRSQSDNYYALGSMIYLHTSKGVQTRQMRIGGIWNSSQPNQVHFGLSKDEQINKLVIVWSNNEKSQYIDITKNNIYTIYK